MVDPPRLGDQEAKRQRNNERNENGQHRENNVLDKQAADHRQFALDPGPVEVHCTTPEPRRSQALPMASRPSWFLRAAWLIFNRERGAI